MTKMKCESTVPSMWFIQRHEKTQNVHNFSMCRATAISRMLYVNSTQLRIELAHVYPIEIVSQTRRFSRKLWKNESYIISNELYTYTISIFIYFGFKFGVPSAGCAVASTKTSIIKQMIVKIKQKKIVLSRYWGVEICSLFGLPPCWNVGTRGHLHRLYTSGSCNNTYLIITLIEIKI